MQKWMKTFFVLLFMSQIAWAQTTSDWAPGSESVIGAGWDFLHIFAGNDGVIYAVDTSGRLIWYRRTDPSSPQPGWAPGTESVIGTGWTFKNVFSGGNGVIYAITSDGQLLWYKRSDPTSNQENWVSGSGSVVGTGWHRFKFVAGAENGVIYAVEPDGRLLWYQRPNPDSSQEQWAQGSGSVVGTGWHTMQHFMTSSNGMIYAVDSANQLLWYQRPNPDSNQESWASGSGNVMGTGWVFDHVFAGDHGRVYAVGSNKNLVWYQYLYGVSGTGGWQKLTDISQLQTGDKIGIKALYFSDYGAIHPANKFLSIQFDEVLRVKHDFPNSGVPNNPATFEIEIIPLGHSENYADEFVHNFNTNPPFVKLMLKASNGHYVTNTGGLSANGSIDGTTIYKPAVLILTRAQPDGTFKLLDPWQGYDAHINQTIGNCCYPQSMQSLSMKGSTYSNGTWEASVNMVNGIQHNQPSQYEVYYIR